MRIRGHRRARANARPGARPAARRATPARPRPGRRCPRADTGRPSSGRSGGRRPTGPAGCRRQTSAARAPPAGSSPARDGLGGCRGGGVRRPAGPTRTARARRERGGRRGRGQDRAWQDLGGGHLWEGVPPTGGLRLSGASRRHGRVAKPPRYGQPLNVQALSLSEQLMLVAVDADRGRLSGISMVYVAMAGGVVLDLVAGGVAVVEDGTLRLDSPTTATALPGSLDENAVAAVSAGVPRDVKHWVRHCAAPRFRLGQQVAAALAQRGMLRIERARRFGLVPVQRLRLLDRQAREELLATAGRALAGAAPPSPRVRDLLV